MVEIDELKKRVYYNYIKVEKGIFKHRQVENRDGHLFMRFKQRPVVIVSSTQ